MALRDIVTKDLGWKTFSVVLAIVIWLTVKSVSSETPVTGTDPLATWATRPFTNLPVLVVSAAADVREFKVSPETVDIRVSARPETIAGISDKEIHVTVDLTDIEAARGLRKRVDVSTPTGVTVVSVVPSEVEIVVPPKSSTKK
jgi:YbbR domain-containing protein